MGGGAQSKPDLILTFSTRRVAYEFEMTRKTDARVYYAFTNHLRAIQEGHYIGVSYLFPEPRLRAKYEALFNAPHWPTTSKYADGRVIAHGNPFNPDDIFKKNEQGARAAKRITFSDECHLKAL